MNIDNTPHASCYSDTDRNQPLHADHRSAIQQAMSAVRGIAQPVAAVSAPTDTSARLRKFAAGSFQGAHDQEKLLQDAADEIERYYGGMMNWKRTAEAKDAARAAAPVSGPAICHCDPNGKYGLASAAPSYIKDADLQGEPCAGILKAMYEGFRRGDSVERVHAAVMAIVDSRPRSEDSLADTVKEYYEPRTIRVTSSEDSRAKVLEEALRIVAQSLAWQAHGECRGFHDKLHTSADAIEVAIRALASSEAPSSGEVAAGHVVVPFTLSDDMAVAFTEVWFSKVRCIDDPMMDDAYAAMLAAAPEAPTNTKGEDE